MSSSQGIRNPITVRPRRQSLPAGEMLEGRQLLSTATTAAGTSSTAAPVASATGMEGMTRQGAMGLRVREARGMMRGLRHQGLPFALASGAMTGDPTGSTSATAPSTSTAVPSTTDPASAAVATPATASLTPTTGGPQGLTGATAQGMSGPMSSGQGMGFAPGGFGGGGFAQGMGFRSGGGFGFGAGPVGTAPTGGSGSTASDPAASALKQYMTDVQTIADKSQVTPALQAALRKDLQAIGKAATTAPDSSKVLALQSDLQSLAGTLPTSDQLATLQADFTAVATSEGVTDGTLATQTFTDLNALIAATTITSTDITTLTTDLKAAGLDTSAPLGHGLGIDLDVLDLAINEHAGQTSTSTTASSTSGSSTTTPAATS